MRANCSRWRGVWAVLIIASFAVAAGGSAGGAEALAPTTADTSLVVGDSYTIRSERHGVKQQFKGELVKANDRWLVLRHIVPRRRGWSIPVLSQVPVVGSTFRGRSTPRTDEYLWIPREAATVESRTPATRPPEPQPMGETPALHVACALELAVDDRVVRREGGMEVMADDSMTLAIPRTVSVSAGSRAFGLSSVVGDSLDKKRTERRYNRIQFARRDVLCVRIGNFDPAELAARMPQD